MAAFSDFGLDDRLYKAICRLGWAEPTLIQEKAIPLTIEGKDLLARARTGTGKTGAFAIPIIDQLLKQRTNCSTGPPKALILVPSRELAAQTWKAFSDLTEYCGRHVRIVDISQVEPHELKPIMANQQPNILISTPARFLAHYDKKSLPLGLNASLDYLVIDEADLMLGFGYKSDLERILSDHVSKSCQKILMSATLNPDVVLLKKMALRNPVVLKLEEPDLPETTRIVQYHIQCDNEEKYTLVNALFKLNLITGRTLIFVNDVDRCYRLKLFLEQFAIHACILNPELPIASRCSVVQKFNTGLYDIIIACDEKCIENPMNRKQRKKRQLMGKRDFTDSEFGASRGIDFHQVSNIINFDFPATVSAYVHRVGRAARSQYGDGSELEGVILSFIGLDEQERFQQVKRFVTKDMPDTDSEQSLSIFKPYTFKMDELEAFKYRSRDALRAVTSVAIREARIKEIKREMLNSQKLKGTLDRNPKDKLLLEHDKSLFTVKHQPHLKHVPDYIVPASLQSAARLSQNSTGSRKRANRIEEEASLTFTLKSKKRNRGEGSASYNKKASRSDPLKTLKIKPIGKPQKRSLKKKKAT